MLLVNSKSFSYLSVKARDELKLEHSRAQRVSLTSLFMSLYNYTQNLTEFCLSKQFGSIYIDYIYLLLPCFLSFFFIHFFFHRYPFRISLELRNLKLIFPYLLNFQLNQLYLFFLFSRNILLGLIREVFPKQSWILTK